MLETQKQKKILVIESQEWNQDEKLTQKTKKWKRETNNIKALVQEQKQLQEHTTAQLSLLHGDLKDKR